MTDASKYWEVWAPYWSYFEDNFLDLESIGKFASVISSPALVVGAGQGLLVEELQKLGLTVDGVDSEPLMVEYAEKRRGLRLLQANGAELPFADNSYKGSIVATGVIDFMEDTALMKSVLDEALRVTEESGEVLVAFYRFHPRAEELMRYMGVLTDEDTWLNRKTVWMSTLSFTEFLKTVQKEANVGFLTTFLTVLKINLLMPSKEKKAARDWKKLWKQVRQNIGDIEPLIDCVPESVPYRDEQSIRALFTQLGFAIHKLFSLDSCRVIQLSRLDSNRSDSNRSMAQTV